MVVSSAEIRNIHPQDKGVCAKADVVLDDYIAINNIRIINGEGGLFIGFPHDGTYNIKDGVKRYNEIVYVKSKKDREILKETLVGLYLNVIGETKE